MSTDLTTPRAKNLALALLAMTQFVIVIDASIVNVALPAIGTDLNMTQTDLSWVINAYVLTFGALLLLGGRLADLLGRRRLFVIGLGLFTLASLLGGLAQNQEWLIAARALQGLGAAVVAPAALSIITVTFEEGAERNRALAIWGAVAGAGGAAGVLLGGVLTEYLGWEWVLFVNVPIGLIGIWQAPLRLQESVVESEHRSFDVPGALSVSAGLALLVYLLVDAPEVGWTSTATLVRAVGAIALLALFLLLEMRVSRPMIPLSIFRLRSLSGANAVNLLVGMALVAMFFLVTFYLQQVLGFSALQAGFGYLPLAGCIIVAAGSASPLITRFGFKPVLLTGLTFLAAGLAWFAVINPDGSYLSDVLGPSILAGIGLGLTFVPVTIAAVTGTSGDQAGLASGLINASQQVGGALGLAILSSVATSRTNEVFADGITDPRIALTEGFQDAFLVGAGIAVLAFLLGALMISSRDSREHAEAARRGEAQIPAA